MTAWYDDKWFQYEILHRYIITPQNLDFTWFNHLKWVYDWVSIFWIGGFDTVWWTYLMTLYTCSKMAGYLIWMDIDKWDMIGFMGFYQHGNVPFFKWWYCILGHYQQPHDIFFVSHLWLLNLGKGWWLGSTLSKSHDSWEIPGWPTSIKLGNYCLSHIVFDLKPFCYHYF